MSEEDSVWFVEANYGSGWTRLEYFDCLVDAKNEISRQMLAWPEVNYRAILYVRE